MYKKDLFKYECERKIFLNRNSKRVIIYLVKVNVEILDTITLHKTYLKVYAQTDS